MAGSHCQVRHRREAGFRSAQCVAGSVPTIAYYDKYFGKGSWKSSTIISLGIGQGSWVSRPCRTRTFSRRSRTVAGFTPHVVKEIGSRHYLPEQFKVKHSLGIDAQYFPVVIDGMENVVEAGTAAASKVKGISICGKPVRHRTLTARTTRYSSLSRRRIIRRSQSRLQWRMPGGAAPGRRRSRH